MNSLTTRKLLALLLALYGIEAPLTEAEAAALKRASEQLTMRPKKWESIIDNLLQAIASNTSFTQMYETALTKLDALDTEIPLKLIPSIAELKEILPPTRNLVERAYDEDRSRNLENTQIFAVATNTLANPETSKKLKSLAKLWQFIKSPSHK